MSISPQRIIGKHLKHRVDPADERGAGQA